MQLPKMRTVTGIMAELRAADPQTAVSAHMIRQIINSGAVPHVASGTRKLVDVDAICAYLASGQQLPAPVTGGIRKVNERGH